jgi:hypothetical protein
MPRSISDVYRSGEYTLQRFEDSEDPFIGAFKMVRREILYQDTRILNILKLTDFLGRSGG